ncbi:MAG: alkaline phosphatase family protein [Planctomycetes bacterium]|nr:alkaline phosphatase family protein [Planctomycetota bacterium]
MRPVVLIDAVGLTPRQVGKDTPAMFALAQEGASAPMPAILPAVTCSAQATLLTGKLPTEHGAVGNGWFDRETFDIALWRQSNALVRGKKLYELAKERDPSFTCAKIFWWWNMGAAVDWSITPRPYYPADGRKIPAVYGSPSAYPQWLEARLGAFPFFDFWGPKSSLASSRWLAEAAIATLEHYRPTLTMVYLPHLDYDHQRFGPNDPRSKRALFELDALVHKVASAAEKAGAATVIVSEYGLEDVTTPVHVNHALRAEGLLAVRETPDGELLDPFASKAFAVADHQVAHVYTKDPQSTAAARTVLEKLAGVERVLGTEEKRAAGLDHPRAGDLVAVAQRGNWFTYYYWLDDERAPDFARTVDIHRKPGYDPCELFLDPHLARPTLRVARRLAQKKLGMRYLMDVIGLDARIVRGSHGRVPDDPQDGPVFLCSKSWKHCGGEPERSRVAMTSVCERVLALLAGDPR